jgi:hypothetical protein
MTAVEQFIEQLEQQGDSWENVSMGTINISIKVEDYLELQRQCKETAEALYRIFCGLSSNCYENAEVYEETKPNMKKAYEKVLDWGRKNCDDTRGETLKSE